MGTHIVFLNDPDYIREILINQAPSFVKERTLKRMKILLGEGLITSDDPIHMRQRRIAAPAFHRQRIAAYADTDRRHRRRHRATAGTPGETIDIAAAMMELSLEIIARTLFDTEVTADIRAINDEVNTIMGIYNFLVALPRLESCCTGPSPSSTVSAAPAPASTPSSTASSPAPPRRRRTRRARQRRPPLHAHRQPLRNEGTEQSQGMSDEQIRDEVLTIFLAGYETVANALTWTWYCLSQNPEAEAQLHAELDTVLGPVRPTRIPYFAGAHER